MFDLQVQDFKEKIIKDINDCGLPLSIISYVLSDVSALVKRSLEDEIYIQKKEREENLNNTEHKTQEVVEVSEEVVEVSEEVVDVSGE